MSTDSENDFTSFQKALVLIPKATGFLSMCGSLAIIIHILKSQKRRRLVYHRLLLGMSCYDLVSSFFLFLSSWAVPSDTDMFWASGSTATCTIHGMFSQVAALATPSYNACLCIYYFLVVCKEFSERKVKEIEIYLHAWPTALGLGTGLAGLPLTLYNPAGFHCWISGLPSGCDQDNLVECERGKLSWIFRWAFFYAWIWLYFVMIAVCIALVYLKVLRQEQRQNRFNRIPGLELDRRRSRRVAYQALLYVGAYYLTFLFGTITRSMQLADRPVPQAIFICFVIFYPLQGFLNAMIYMSPRFYQWRQDNPSASSLAFVLPKSKYFSTKPNERKSRRNDAGESSPDKETGYRDQPKLPMQSETELLAIEKTEKKAENHESGVEDRSSNEEEREPEVTPGSLATSTSERQHGMAIMRELANITEA